MQETITIRSIIGITLFFAVAYIANLYMYKLYRYMESQHKEKLESMNLPKRMWGILYYVTPTNAINLFRFTLSKECFDDAKIRFLKRAFNISCLASAIIFLLLGFDLL